MIIDLQELYRKAEQETQGKITFDNYPLKEGIYLKLDVNKSLEQNENEQKDRLLVVKKKEEVTPSKIELKDWFLPRDFYSNAISANKFVDTGTKKLHNTNFLTLFMKLDTFIADDPKKAKEEKKDKFLLEDEWATYIYKFYTEKLEAADRKMNKLSGYPKLKQWIVDDKRKIKKKRYLDFLITNKTALIQWIADIKNQSNAKNYLKIFFNDSEENYEKESKIYLFPSIFLKDDFNIVIDDEVYGMPSYNIGLNDKKPYLKMRTKKSDVPLLVSPEEAVLRRKLFSWLGNQAPFVSNQIQERDLFFANDNQKLNETIHFMFIPDTKGNVVNYYEKIPFSRSDRLENPFYFKNIIHAQEWEKSENSYSLSLTQDSAPIRDPNVLFDLTSRLFFKNYLHKTNMLFAEPQISSGVFPAEMLNLLLESRQALYDFFEKGTSLTLRPMIDSLSRQSIDIQLMKTIKGSNVIGLGQAFNLRLAWLSYFNIGSDEKVQRLSEFVTNLKTKFNRKEVVDIDSPEEFYFLAGQVSSYLLALSEADDKNYGMYEGVFKAKKVELLKHQIYDLFSTYEHKISSGFYFFKNVNAALSYYRDLPDLIGNDARDYLRAGIFAQNMFYTDKKDGDKQ